VGLAWLYLMKAHQLPKLPYKIFLKIALLHGKIWMNGYFLRSAIGKIVVKYLMLLIISSLVIKCRGDFSLLNKTRKCGFTIFYCLVFYHIYLLLPTHLLGGYSRDVEIHARTTKGMLFGIFFHYMHCICFLSFISNFHPLHHA
jgi:hypothetical protein